MRDPQGLAAPGATVTITSAALMGERSATSDQDGFFRVINLPPGVYRVEASLQGFGTFAKANVRVDVGSTTAVDPILMLGTLAEQLVVVADSAPVLDAERTEQRFIVDKAAIEALPVEGRLTYQSLWQLLPGVTGGTNPFVNASFLQYEGGATGVRNQHDIHETNIFIDGMNINDPMTGLNTTNLAYEAIAEVNIQTAGFEAEFGSARNAQMQVVTKSGGNALSGSALLQFQPESWNATNVEGSSSQQLKYYRPSLTLGGPLKRDKVWFFGSWLYDYEDLTFPNTRAVDTLKRQRRGSVWYGKLTTQLDNANQLSASFGYDRTRVRNGTADTGNVIYATDDAMTTQVRGGPLFSLRWTSTLSPSAVLQVQGGYQHKPEVNDAQGEGPRLQYFNAFRGSLARIEGNGERNYDSPRHVVYIQPNLTFFPGDFLGRHELKLGVEARPYQKIGRAFVYNADALGFHSYSYGLDFQRYGLSAPYLYEATRANPVGPYNEVKVAGYAAYLQDRWHPIEKLTINAGLRWEKQTHRTFHRSELPASLESFDPNIRSDVELDDAAVAPRLGVAYDLGRNGILRGSAGRFYERVGTGDYNNYPRGQGFSTYRVPEASFGRGPEALAVFTSGTLPVNPAHNRNMRMEHNDEYSLGYERRLPGDLALDATFIHRKVYVSEASDANVVFANGTFQRIDPSFDAVNRREFPTGDQRERDISYKSLQLTLRRNFTQRSGVLANFSRIWTRMDYRRFDPTETFQFAYASPDDLDQSSYGPRWTLKLSAYYTFPADFSVATFLTGVSGEWINDISGDFAWNADPPRVVLSNGRLVPDIIFQARNAYFAGRRFGISGRYTDNVYTLNLRAQKRFHLGGARRFEVSIDLYNALNSAAFQGFQSADARRTDLYPNRINPQRPRAIQANARFVF